MRSRYPIADLQVDVQQPLKATGFTVSPPADLINVGQDGFKFHLFSHRTLAVGEELKLHISYTKTDPGPSVTRQPFLEPGAAAPAATPTSGQGLNPAALLIVVGVAGLLVGGGYWYVNQQRADDLHDDEEWEPPRRARHPRRDPSAEAVTGYCHQCGKGLRADDRFCPGCGTRRRQA